MIDLNEFRKKATKDNLCAEYTKIWDGCKSKKQLMDMCLSVKGIDYVCNAIAKGWGISPIVLVKDFGRFINGNYTAELDGYTSKLFCRFVGDIKADTTIIGLVDSVVSLEVPKNALCEVYCSGECEINLSGEGECAFVCYGDIEKTIINGTCGNFKRIDKKDRDRYD